VSLILVVCVVIILAGAGLSYRNLCVYNYKRDILDVVSVLAQADIQLGLSWEWRYEMFNSSPSYTSMLFQFWRPLDSFYKDSPMLEAPMLEPPPGMIV
jgi:hypothetical protein